MRITGLGQGVDKTGALAAEAMTRTLHVLNGYGALLRQHGVGRQRAVATSATRDASNGSAFLDAAEHALGVKPERLSGDAEARLSFQGATAGLASSRGPFLVFDIGGGSTEFVLGLREPEALVSVQLGCVRLSERHLHTDPPTAAQLEACFADTRHELGRVRSVLDVSRARTVLGLAGTVTAIAALQLGLDHYDARRTHHSVLTLAQVETQFMRLSAVNLAERRALLAEPKRADSILGGAAALLTILRELSIAELLVSEHDILDGLAASLL
jgi:exopolyphosphatase/guanosine-5'-triphosphate,3'-diphosphate pyrophosphatase